MKSLQNHYLEMGMRNKARKLLKTMIMTAWLLSGVFPGCYVIDSLRPDLPDNTPAVIDYKAARPEIYDTVDIKIDETLYYDFFIPIVDPDPEGEIYGKFVIDYDPLHVPVGRDFIVSRKEGSESEWEGTFKIQVDIEFDAGECHEIMAVISDRPWAVSEEDPFAVPESTVPAYIRWVIKLFDEIENPLESVKCY